MRRSFLLLLAVALIAPVVAQDTGEWYLDQFIIDIRFVGLSTVAETELEPIVTPFVGQTFTWRRFEDLQRRLYALDFFTSIVPEAVRPESGSGVVLQFTVEEHPTVDEVRFTGNRRIRTNDLLDVTLLKTGDMITTAKRRVDEQAIFDLYIERGYPDVEVYSEVLEEETDRGIEHVVSFRITEGRQVTVREILFSGNDFASASTLRSQMETKQQSIFNSGVYQSAVLEQDRINIETYYRERGYVDARVVDITQELERDDERERNHLILTVYIEEGNQYTFGGITIAGNTIYESEELRDLIRLRDEAILNAVRLEDGLVMIKSQYEQDGYIYNRYDIQERRDDQALVIEYALSIVEQPRAHIENIIIRGNEKTLDHVILREIPLEVGDIFSTARIWEGIQNLYNLQYFTAINPESPPGSVEGLMDLVINVEEAQTADIRFGVQFGGSREFPVAAQVGWSDTNFRGQGQTLGFNVQLSPIEQLASINFLERWFMGRRWSLGADLSVGRSVRNGIPQDILAPVFSEDDLNAVPDPFLGYYVFSRETEYPDGSGTTYQRGDPFPDAVTEELIDDYDLITDYEYAGGLSAIPDEYLMNYTEWEIGVGANTGYRFRTQLGTLTLATSVRSTLNYVGYDPSTVRPFDAELRANLDDWQWINKWGLSATLDRRRGIILSPSSGYAVSQGVTFVGGFLLGDRHYIRTDSRGEAYFTLWDLPVFDNWNWKTVLALHSEISFVLPTFWVPQEYRSMEQPIAGTDLLATNMMFIARGWEPVTGGEALWNNWVELRMPIFENFLWTDTFFDAVNLWEDPADIGNMGIENMLFGFGAGIRFTIPQFPIRLYLAKRFRFDETGAIQWQQGSLFNYNDTPTGGLDFVFAIGADLF
jgi:outer membrane protein insertion porin family